MRQSFLTFSFGTPMVTSIMSSNACFTPIPLREEVSMYPAAPYSFANLIPSSVVIHEVPFSFKMSVLKSNFDPISLEFNNEKITQKEHLGIVMQYLEVKHFSHVQEMNGLPKKKPHQNNLFHVKTNVFFQL
jgi:hypothetical protein